MRTEYHALVDEALALINEHGTINAMKHLATAVSAAEREACAQRCDAEANDPNNWWAHDRAMAAHCAKAIRARQ